jgi:hypothetical protein
MQQLIGGHVGEDEAGHLGRIKVAGDLDRIHLRHTHALGVGAPDRQRCHPVARSQPRAARAQLLDHADELVAGRERRLGHAEIGAGAQLGIGKGHPRRQHPDADLADPRPRIVLLYHPQHLGPAIALHDHALHRPQLLVRAAPASGRCSERFLLTRLACSD